MNARSLSLVALTLVSTAVVACSAEPASEEATELSSSAVTGPALRAVDVIVSAKKSGEDYEARAYPVDDVNGDGLVEYYRAPVFYVYVDGVNAAGEHVRHEWKAPRFMPYNNPAGALHDDGYKTVGFVTAGLSSISPMPAFSAFGAPSASGEPASSRMSFLKASKSPRISTQPAEPQPESSTFSGPAWM